MTLRMCIKIITQDHVTSKPDMLLCSELKSGLISLIDENNDKDSLFKVGIAIMHFGMLRRMETFSVEIKDVKAEEVVKIEHPYKTKRRSKGFRFVLHDWLIETFEKH